MDSCLRKQIRALIEREVVPATGCTEPGAVALCVAKACKVLAMEPEHISVQLSKNIFKNAMGVGIPGTGMIGLPIAIAMAVTHGDPERGLEVLTMPRQQVDNAKQWLANHANAIEIGVKDTVDKLYCECHVQAGEHTACAVIASRHTNFVFVKHDEQVLLDTPIGMHQPSDDDCDPASEAQPLELSIRTVYDYATTTPIEELQFITQTVALNTAAGEEGSRGMGLHTGEVLLRQAGDDIVHRMVALTVCASDARMDGCTRPVYSNSGSGNQGICCTLPPYYYGKLTGCDDEQITRALAMSHLMSIYIKQGIGRLSAMCGLVNASMGVCAALVYLRGGGYDHICYALKNMINTIAGMVCDGAKPSCALKMSTGLYSAYVCSSLALAGHAVEPTDGLSECCPDRSIANLARLGKEGMYQTDDIILDIMTHKRN